MILKDLIPDSANIYYALLLCSKHVFYSMGSQYFYIIFLSVISQNISCSLKLQTTYQIKQYFNILTILLVFFEGYQIPMELFFKYVIKIILIFNLL